MLSRLDREMTLEAQVATPDGAGGRTLTWTPVGRIWVGLRSARGREAAGQVGALSEARWTATLRGAAPGDPARPMPGQRLREGLRTFRILSVAERDGRGRWMVCELIEEAAT